MPQRYFEKFPVITYANNKAIDITERVVFANNTISNPDAFQYYDLSNYERTDQLANRYYEDSFYTWLIYLSNKITDPYYEWYLTEEQFNEFIIKKYGSIENAQNKIMHYRNNWPGSDPITISDFDALPENLKSYWTPQYGLNGSIISYVRKEDDIIVNTNNIRAYEVSNSSFIKDEICEINFSNNYVGRGQVMFANNNYVYLYHTSGTTLPNTTVYLYSSSYLYGHESNVNTTFYSADSYANNLTLDQIPYFSPVYYYDYEREKNEINKSVKMVQNRYAEDISRNLKKELLK